MVPLMAGQMPVVVVPGGEFAVVLRNRPRRVRGRPVEPGFKTGPYNEHNPAAQGKIATAPTASPIARFLPLN